MRERFSPKDSGLFQFRPLKYNHYSENKTARNEVESSGQGCMITMYLTIYFRKKDGLSSRHKS